MHPSFTVRALALVAVGAIGCAHTGANQYAYAPPLAPPVYPQPQPVAGPGPIVAAPVLEGAPVVNGVPLSAANGTVPANPDGSCPPCLQGATALPVGYEAAVQTQPCPQ